MRKVNNHGFSLMEVIIVAGISVVIMMAVSTMFFNENRQSKALAEKLAGLDFQNLLIASLADGALCDYFLTNPAEAGNRSTNVINTLSLKTAIINLKNIPQSSTVPNPALTTIGKSVSPIAPNLRVQSIQINNFTGAADSYTANLRVNFDNTQTVISVQPVIASLHIQTNPASPPNAKQITGCAAAAATSSIICTHVVRSSPNGNTTYSYGFAAGECTGGVLPDATYTGTFKSANFIGGATNYIVLDSGQPPPSYCGAGPLPCSAGPGLAAWVTPTSNAVLPECGGVNCNGFFTVVYNKK